MKPLQGVRVLDLTHMLSGPYGAMLLSDLGAETIKVEPPGSGEGTRQLLSGSKDFSRDGMGAYFLTLNRGKRSVAVNLKDARGREVFYDLVRCADVVINNFSVGVPQRLGIDYATLTKINPRIITCSVTGFGETGPDPHRPAFDQVVQGMGGGMSITGSPDEPPVRSGIPIGDLGGGLFGALGVLAALHARERSGVGQHVDISMLDAQISLLNYMATMYLMSGQVPGRIGNAHFVHVPYNTYQTADGYVIIACIGDEFFRRLVDVLPRPELLDPRYERQPERFADRERIDAIVNEELATQPSAVWLERLRAARVPCAPVNNFAQALSDPQVVARDMVVDVQLTSGSHVQMPGNPIKLSADIEPLRASAPPGVGEHTEEILSQLLGYSAEQISALRATGCIQ